jgi:exodeoxyribonuclease-3
MLTVGTINVAGLRGATITGKGPRGGAGLQEWFGGLRADPGGIDVLAFQETKVNADQIGDSLIALGIEREEFILQEDRFRKGHAGVGMWVNPQNRLVTEIRTPLEDAENSERYSYSGRWLEVDLDPDITVVSSYFHHAESPTAMSRAGVRIDREKSVHSMDSKHHFIADTFARIRQLRESGRKLIIMGDVNIAHTEIDIKNAKGNRTKAGFLPEERVWLDLLLGPKSARECSSELDRLKEVYRYNPEIDYSPPATVEFDRGFVGLHDVTREFFGPEQRVYTWWTNMGHAFDNDAGWRIDYQFTDEALAKSVVELRVDRQSDFATRFSDHAPLLVKYDI